MKTEQYFELKAENFTKSYTWFVVTRNITKLYYIVRDGQNIKLQKCEVSYMMFKSTRLSYSDVLSELYGLHVYLSMMQIRRFPLYPWSLVQNSKWYRYLHSDGLLKRICFHFAYNWITTLSIFHYILRRKKQNAMQRVTAHLQLREIFSIEHTILCNDNIIHNVCIKLHIQHKLHRKCNKSSAWAANYISRHVWFSFISQIMPR